MVFAQIDNGTVTAILRADMMPTKNLPVGRAFVQIQDGDRAESLLGGTCDTTTREITPPPAPADYGATVDPRTFLFLLTADERKAIRRAAKIDEDVEDFMAIASVPMPIRLRHPNTVAGFAMLVAKNLLTQQRATAIMNTPPQ